MPLTTTTSDLAGDWEHPQSTPRQDFESAARKVFEEIEGATNFARVSDKAADKLVERAREALLGLTQDYLDGHLSLAGWQRLVSQEIKDLHVRAGILGYGKAFDEQARNYVNERAAKQIHYLFGFAGDLSTGRQAADETALRRISMYADAGRHTYQGAIRRRTGATFERRILAPEAQHCPECLDYAGRGWQPAGELPDPGDACSCVSNCLCELEFSHDDVAPPEEKSSGPEPMVRVNLPKRIWDWLRKMVGFSGTDELQALFSDGKLQLLPFPIPYPTTSDAFEFYEQLSRYVSQENTKP